MATVTIPKKEYQELKIKAEVFDRYLKESAKRKILKEFERALRKTNRYQEKFIRDLVESERDILEGDIKEVILLKSL